MNPCGDVDLLNYNLLFDHTALTRGKLPSSRGRLWIAPCCIPGLWGGCGIGGVTQAVEGWLLGPGLEECIQGAQLLALLEETEALQPLCSPGHLIQALHGERGAWGMVRRREGGQEKKGSPNPWPRRNEHLWLPRIPDLSRSHGRTWSSCQSFRQKQ